VSADAYAGAAADVLAGVRAARRRYPYVCAEVLCSDLWPVVEGCLADDGCLLGRFWETVLDRPPEDMKARVSMAAHFAKINGVFMGRKPKEARLAIVSSACASR
jgi:serine/threonine-protein phosphatase 6 regulatory subunit 3